VSGVPTSGDERTVLERLATLLGPPPAGEVWAGDDAAVVENPPGHLLFSTDALVEGVHFTRALSSLEDIGWKALACNLSDLAAMGGRPLAAVVALCGAAAADLDGIYRGVTGAAERYGCAVVGGDLSDAEEMVVTVAVLGTTDGRPPVLRSGGRPGDRLFVTGPLGSSAAGLRLLRAGEGESNEAVRRHRRPLPRLGEGTAAAELGASAMLDLSDGLSLDLDRLARASGVGVELITVPVAAGASEEEALGGGEDYELLFSLPPGREAAGLFAARGLATPIEIGVLVGDRDRRTLRGAPLPLLGYLHRLSGGRPEGE